MVVGGHREDGLHQRAMRQRPVGCHGVDHLLERRLRMLQRPRAHPAGLTRGNRPPSAPAGPGVRSTTVLTNMPMSAAVSALSRPATAVPIEISPLSPSRENTAASAAYWDRERGDVVRPRKGTRTPAAVVPSSTVSTNARHRWGYADGDGRRRAQQLRCTGQFIGPEHQFLYSSLDVRRRVPGGHHAATARSRRTDGNGSFAEWDLTRQPGA